MGQLSLAFLGSFQRTLDGKPIGQHVSQKALALLAYLAVESARPHGRETLAGLLWPDMSDDAARINLRTALYSLRQALGDRETPLRFLLVSPREIQFNTASHHRLDVDTFCSCLAPCAHHPQAPLDVCRSCAPQLEEAASLYRGDFLAELPSVGSVGFEEWAVARREEFHRQAMATYARLEAWHERRREYAEAARYARRELGLEPWREDAHRQLMRALALGGDRSEALRQFEICRQALDRELNVEPAPETTRLAGEIRAQIMLPVTAAPDNPFKGLDPFSQADAAGFRGREQFLDRLVDAVKACPVTAVTGPSGSGKSSAIFAGLLPRLGQAAFSGCPDASNGSWLVAAFRPGDRPFERLVASLLPLMPAGRANGTAEARKSAAPVKLRGEMETLAAALSRREVSLTGLIKEVVGGTGWPASERLPDTQASGRLRVLVVIDQFEDLYTRCPADLRRSFVEALSGAYREAVGHHEAPADVPELRLLLAVRSAFLGQLLADRALAPAIRGSTLTLGPMSRQEMARWLEEAARDQSIRWEPGLAGRLLEDLGEEPGALPILQSMLLLLWERQRNGVLTHEAYERIGGVHGGFAAYAEQVYLGLSAPDQSLARQVLLRLVRSSRTARDAPCCASRNELGEERWSVVRRLADARLVVTGYDQQGGKKVELAHSVLIDHWPRLRNWLSEDREFRLWQEDMRSAVLAWEAGECDPGALLRGSRLAEAERWAFVQQADVPRHVLAYIAASLAHHQTGGQAPEPQRRDGPGWRSDVPGERRWSEDASNLSARGPHYPGSQVA